jgi:hypothetical protein
MMYQKLKTNIYKHLQNVIYLLNIFKKKINICLKFSEKVMGFIMKFKNSYKNKQQSKQIRKLAHY